MLCTFLLCITTLPVSAFAGGFVIAAYGDSLSGPYPNKWCGHVQPPDSCDWTYGAPGERTEVGSARLIADLAAGWIDPETTHITLAWGANDIRRGGFDWEGSFEQPLRAAVTAVLDAGFEPVLVVTLDQYQTSPGQSLDECDTYPLLQQKLDSEFSPRIYSIANDYEPELIVVDLNSAYDALPESTKCPGVWNDGFYRDHVHQTDEGYQFMADEFVDAIAVAAPEPGAVASSLVALSTVLGVIWLRHQC